MASTVLGAAGKSIGFALGGPVGAIVGGMIGAAVGSVIDAAIMRALAPDQKIEGPKVTQVGLAAPREGQALARGYGWRRCEARHIWPRDPRFIPRVTKTKTRSDGKGGGPSTTTTEHDADITFAVAISEGPIGGIRRVWADGNLVDLSKYDFTLYYGDADQDPDPTMEEAEGEESVPDYRGVAYMVFRNLPVTDDFGGRIPQFSFEVYSGARVSAIANSADLPDAPLFVIPTIDDWDEPLDSALNADTLDVDLFGVGPVNGNAHQAISIVMAYMREYRRAGRGDEPCILHFCTGDTVLNNAWTPANVASATVVRGYNRVYEVACTPDDFTDTSFGSLVFPYPTFDTNPRTNDVLDTWEELKRKRDVDGATFASVIWVSQSWHHIWDRTYSEGGGEPANLYQFNQQITAITDEFKADDIYIQMVDYGWAGSLSLYTVDDAPQFDGDSGNGWRPDFNCTFGMIDILPDANVSDDDVRAWWMIRQYELQYDPLLWDETWFNGGVDEPVEIQDLLGELYGNQIDIHPYYYETYGMVDYMLAKLFGAYRTPFNYEANGGLGAGGVGLLGVQEFSTDVEAITRADSSDDGVVLARDLENTHISSGAADFLFSIDHLAAQHPEIGTVKIPITWFGNDLRAGVCTIRPKVDAGSKSTEADEIRIAGLTRSGMGVISTVSGEPAFASSPNDASIIRAILNLKARGLQVILEPLLEFDIAPGNGLTDPWGGAEQEAYPRRDRVTVTPAIGEGGTVDKTAAAATQIGAFFGGAIASEFTTGAELVTYSGSEWSYSRFVLHVAALAKAAGGVDAILLGSNLVGITRPRSDATTFPAAAELAALAAEVKTLAGSGTEVSYAGATGEIAAWAPPDGSGDVLFPLDGFYSDATCDFVGVYWREPLSDWRNFPGHLDAVAGHAAIYSRSYLAGNVEGGENYDWTYADAAARKAQTRTPITDAAEGEPWVFRSKDIRSWQALAHHDRPGGVRNGSPTAWVPGSKRIALFSACPAIEKGANAPGVELHPRTGRAAPPHFSNGARDDDMQRAYHRAFAEHWEGDNLVSTALSCVEGWDARPWPEFAASDAWSDAALWPTGIWISGRAAVLMSEIIAGEADYFGIADRVDLGEVLGGAQGFKIEGLTNFRSVAESIRGVFQVEFAEVGGRIRAESLLLKPIAASYTIDADAIPLEGDRRFERIRSDAKAAPKALWLQATSAVRDYSTETVVSHLELPGAERELRLEAPLVLDSDLQEQRAVIAHLHAKVQGDARRFALPPSATLRAVPGALLEVDFGQGAETVLVEERDLAGGLTLEARVVDKGVLRPIPVRRRLGAAVQLGLASDIVPAYLDLPALAAGADPLIGYVAGFRDPWTVLRLHRSEEAQTGFIEVKQLTVPAGIGVTLTDLAAGDPDRWENGPGLEVEFYGGELVSRSETEILAGFNALAIAKPGADPLDAWEIIQFRDAELIAPRRWRISRRLRGLRDTGPAAIPAGARVVALDSAVFSAGVTLGDIGVSYYWKMGPADRDVADPAYVSTVHAYQGRARFPFAPVHGLVRDSAGDLAISWIRRDRDPDAENWANISIPMTEAALAFEVDILEETAPGVFAVKRTLSTASEAATYDAAAIAADAIPAGAAFADIFQISAAVGRGAALRLPIG